MNTAEFSQHSRLLYEKQFLPVFFFTQNDKTQINKKRTCSLKADISDTHTTSRSSRLKAERQNAPLCSTNPYAISFRISSIVNIIVKHKSNLLRTCKRETNPTVQARSIHMVCVCIPCSLVILYLTGSQLLT